MTSPTENPFRSPAEPEAAPIPRLSKAERLLSCVVLLLIAAMCLVLGLRFPPGR